MSLISDELISDNLMQYRQPDLTYRLGNDSVVGNIDGLNSIKQSIYHILSTERYSNPIYDDNYGVELEQYIGKDIEYIQADIGSTLREALIQDDRIIDVIVTDVRKSEIQKNSCIIEFIVSTIYGDLNQNINIIN